MITLNEVLFRLFISVLLGGMVGLERRYHDKPAGFMTNTLICVGSTVFALCSIYSSSIYGGDPARIAAQVVAGVGFLGAGSILREGNKISGLTTAASIWLVAAVGLAIGFGNFVLASAATLSVLMLQFIVRAVMDAFDHVRLYESITIKCEPDWSVVEKINATITRHKAEILKEEIFKDEGLFIIKLVVNMSAKTFSSTFRELLALKEIKFLDK
jgi:putative Mg2+ transporter-C (MgtC) family protein